MKYKHIIQEMREASDPSMSAFVKDLEKMKRLTKKEKDHYLQTRFLPESVQKLVEDFIPYIIFVAYGYSQKTKTLQLLDLINEGILGAYRAFEISTKDGVLTKLKVYYFIKAFIRKAYVRDLRQTIAEYSFDTCLPEGPVDEEGEIADVECGNIKRLLMDMLMKNLGMRDANIVYDYYWGRIEDLNVLGDKYGLNRERCRQVIKKVKHLDYSEIMELKGYLR